MQVVNDNMTKRPKSTSPQFSSNFRDLASLDDKLDQASKEADAKATKDQSIENDNGITRAKRDASKKRVQVGAKDILRIGQVSWGSGNEQVSV